VHRHRYLDTVRPTKRRRGGQSSGVEISTSGGYSKDEYASTVQMQYVVKRLKRW
jgi:hypothetical protein